MLVNLYNFYFGCCYCMVQMHVIWWKLYWEFWSGCIGGYHIGFLVLDQHSTGSLGCGPDHQQSILWWWWGWYHWGSTSRCFIIVWLNICPPTQYWVCACIWWGYRYCRIAIDGGIIEWKSIQQGRSMGGGGYNNREGGWIIHLTKYLQFIIVSISTSFCCQPYQP